MSQSDSVPNVVVIMADQLRWDALGDHTPVIQGLLEESVVFPRAYCASPICVPARGAFFTGRYPNRTGSIINPWEPLDSRHGDVRAGTPNLYSILETHWDSHHVGKQHLFTEDRIHEQPGAKTDWNSLEKGYKPYLEKLGHRAPGGDRFRGIVPEMVGGRITRARKYSVPSVGCYEHGFDSFFDGYIANTALDAIRRRDRTKPLLLNAMFVAPHPPYDIPEPWYSMITDVELPESVGRWYDDQSPLQLYNLPGAIGVRYSREEWRRVWEVYLGLVALLDHAVGLILDALREEGIYDETLILFCADHGEMLGSHMMYQKMCMYEPSVRTPLAWKLPASKRMTPHSVDALVSGIDVLPTICELVGVDAPNGIDGHSLDPLMRGDPGGRERVFIQFDGNGARGNFQRAVVEGEYKLIVDIFKDEQYLELYDVLKDPEETTNLAFDPRHRDRLNTLVDRLRDHMVETGDLLTLREKTVESFISDYAAVQPSLRR